MKLHLVDGTYELFRAFYGAPPKAAPDGREVGAVVGLINSLLVLLGKDGATHVGVAFDHVIPSFRNNLYPGYKTGADVDPKLLAQFELAEQAARALGLVVWPMIEFEADDAIASAAEKFVKNKAVEQIVVCSPDKDLAQLVDGERVVCWDRRREVVYDAAAVPLKYGVPPASIPDWLALVGDSADGFPGIAGWGEKSAAAVLTKFGHLEAIPTDPAAWGLGGRAARLSDNLRAGMRDALLFRTLATLRRDVPITETVRDLEWRGAHESLRGLCVSLGAPSLPGRVTRWR
jgi:5'-3' exonuclease